MHLFLLHLHCYFSPLLAFSWPLCICVCLPNTHVQSNHILLQKQACAV